MIFLEITDPEERRFNPSGNKTWGRVMSQDGGVIEVAGEQILDIQIRPNGKILIQVPRGLLRVDATSQLVWVDIQAGSF